MNKLKELKKYWKIILVCLFVLIAIGIGFCSCEIEKPEDNITTNKNDNGAIEDNNVLVESKDDTSENKVADESGENISEVQQAQNDNTKQSEVVIDNGSIKVDTPQPPVEEVKEKHYVTMSIDCLTILNNIDKLKTSAKPYVPTNGYIFSSSVEFNPGETALDLIKRVAKNKGIPLDQNGGYISGINNIYEFDCGKLSGWMYSINGSFSKVGATSYALQDGDVVKFRYTCDLGKDLGDAYER